MNQVSRLGTSLGPSRPLVGRRSRTRGFSLVELTVTLLIVVWILAFVSQILLQSMRLSQAAVNSMLRANLELTEASLRRDASAAASFPLAASWTREPLTMQVDGSSVSYRMSGGALVRETTPLLAETPTTTTQTLAPLEDFRWYSENGTTIWLAWMGGSPTRSGTGRNPLLTRVEVGLFADRHAEHRLFLASRLHSSRAW